MRARQAMLPKPRFFTLFSASDHFVIFNAISRKIDDLRNQRVHMIRKFTYNCVILCSRFILYAILRKNVENL